MAAKYNPKLTGFTTKGGRRVLGTRKQDVRLGLLTDELMAKINDGARNAAVQVMNEIVGLQFQNRKEEVQLVVVLIRMI